MRAHSPAKMVNGPMKDFCDGNDVTQNFIIRSMSVSTFAFRKNKIVNFIGDDLSVLERTVEFVLLIFGQIKKTEADPGAHQRVRSARRSPA